MSMKRFTERRTCYARGPPPSVAEAQSTHAWSPSYRSFVSCLSDSGELALPLIPPTPLSLRLSSIIDRIARPGAFRVVVARFSLSNKRDFTVLSVSLVAVSLHVKPHRRRIDGVHEAKLLTESSSSMRKGLDDEPSFGIPWTEGCCLCRLRDGPATPCRSRLTTTASSTEGFLSTCSAASATCASSVACASPRSAFGRVHSVILTIVWSGWRRIILC